MAAAQLRTGLTSAAAAELHPSTARVVFAILAVVAAATLLMLGLGMTFFADEWSFIESRSLAQPLGSLLPHNEHWVALPALLYRVLVETLGIGSYVPFHLALVLLHVAVAALVFRALGRSSGPILALAGGSLVLFLGGGFEDLFWAFQISFVGSLLLGLVAMALTDGEPGIPRATTIAVLLLAALASSGVGAVVAIAVGVEWLLDRRWRRWAWVLAVPASIYAAWNVTYARIGVTVRRDPVSMEALLDAPGAVVEGLAAAARTIVGLPGGVSLVAIAIVVVVAAARRRDEIAWPRVLGVVAAIAAQYALIGLVRAQLFEGIIDLSRYAYVSAILGLIGLGAIVGPVRLPLAGGRRLAGLLIVGSWLALALTYNLQLLVLGRAIFLERAAVTRALVTVALEPLPDSVDREKPLVLVPSPASLTRIVARYGDPRGDAIAPWAVPAVRPELREAARRRVLEGPPPAGLSD